MTVIISRSHLIGVAGMFLDSDNTLEGDEVQCLVNGSRIESVGIAGAPVFVYVVAVIHGSISLGTVHIEVRNSSIAFAVMATPRLVMVSCTNVSALNLSIVIRDQALVSLPVDLSSVVKFFYSFVAHDDELFVTVKVVRATVTLCGSCTVVATPSPHITATVILSDYGMLVFEANGTALLRGWVFACSGTTNNRSSQMRMEVINSVIVVMRLPLGNDSLSWLHPLSSFVSVPTESNQDNYSVSLRLHCSLLECIDCFNAPLRFSRRALRPADFSDPFPVTEFDVCSFTVSLTAAGSGTLRTMFSRSVSVTPLSPPRSSATMSDSLTRVTNEATSTPPLSCSVSLLKANVTKSHEWTRMTHPLHFSRMTHSLHFSPSDTRVWEGTTSQQLSSTHSSLSMTLSSRTLSTLPSQTLSTRMFSARSFSALRTHSEQTKVTPSLSSHSLVIPVSSSAESPSASNPQEHAAAPRRTPFAISLSTSQSAAFVVSAVLNAVPFSSTPLLAQGMSSMQMSSQALSLAARCRLSSQRENDEGAATPIFSEPMDNPFSLHLDSVGSDELSYAAGSLVGNIGVVLCFFALRVSQKLFSSRASLRSDCNALAIAHVLRLCVPGDLYSSVMPVFQPTIAASVALLASPARSGATITISLCFLTLVIFLPTFLSKRLLVTHGFFASAIVAPRLPLPPFAPGFKERIVRMLHIWIVKVETWELPAAAPRTEFDSYRRVFDCFRTSNVYYFLVKAVERVAFGVVGGTAFALLSVSSKRACEVSQWAFVAFVVLSFVSLAASLAIRPFSTKFDDVVTNMLCIFSLCIASLSLARYWEEAEILALVQTILGVVMCTLKIVAQVLYNRFHDSLLEHWSTQQQKYHCGGRNAAVMRVRMRRSVQDNESLLLSFDSLRVSESLKSAEVAAVPAGLERLVDHICNERRRDIANNGYLND